MFSRPKDLQHPPAVLSSSSEGSSSDVPSMQSSPCPDPTSFRAASSAVLEVVLQKRPQTESQKYAKLSPVPSQQGSMAGLSERPSVVRSRPSSKLKDQRLLQVQSELRLRERFSYKDQIGVRSKLADRINKRSMLTRKAAWRRRTPSVTIAASLKNWAGVR